MKYDYVTEGGKTVTQHTQDPDRPAASTAPAPTVPAPTPWRWTASGKPTGKSLARFHIYVEDKDGRKIAAVWGRDGEREATANLLVAAPVLRDALRKVVGCAYPAAKGILVEAQALRMAQDALAMLDDDQAGAP